MMEETYIETEIAEGFGYAGAASILNWVETPNTLDVILDGVKYTVAPMSVDNMFYAGDLAPIMGMPWSSDSSFLIVGFPEGIEVLFPNEGSHTLSISVVTAIYNKLPAHYLPDNVGGNSLPEVTTNDNGNILRVVDGEWRIVSIVDSYMSDSSTNAVQNKVIKKYIDDTVSSAIASAIADKY
jgi:hypothetical protein